MFRGGYPILTYTTLDNDVLNVSTLTDAEAAFLDRCFAAFRARMEWGAFANLVSGPENPSLEPGVRITRTTLENPLYRAVRDLEDRLGILQGDLAAAPGDDPQRDPTADEFISIAVAAASKHVTIKAVHKAINRGDLVVDVSQRPARVSRNSLDHWCVNQLQQEAGRKARVTTLKVTNPAPLTAGKTTPRHRGLQVS